MENFGLGLVLQFTDKASIGIGRVTSTLNVLEQSARRTQGVISSLGHAMTALGAIGQTFTMMFTMPVLGFLTKIMQMAVQRSADVEMLQISFETLLGTAKDASLYLDKIMGYAKTTPYRFNDLASVAQTMIGYGMDANVVLKQTEEGFEGVIPALADWSGAMSKGMGGVQQLSYVLSKANSLGHMNGQLLMQMEGAGLQASKIIGNLYNMSEEKAAKFIKSMPVNQFMSDLVRGIEEGTDGPNGTTAAMKGMVEKLRHTWTGAKDYFVSAMTNAGRSLMGIYTDENGQEQNKYLHSMTESLNNISDSILNIVSVFQPLIDMAVDFSVRITAGLKSITEAYKNLDDSTKKTIGNIVAFIVLLGPALVLMSKFGMMVVKTVSILKSFSSVVGLVTLLTSAAVIGVSTNFGGMRDEFLQFTTDLFNSITEGLTALTGGADAVKEKMDELVGDDSFISKITQGVMKLVGFVKILSALWTNENFLTDEEYNLMEALGITEAITAINAFKNNAQAFLRGFKQGLLEVYEKVKVFIEKVEQFLGNTALGEFVRSLGDVLKYGKTDYFEELGRSAAKILPVVLALQSVLSMLPSVSTIASLLSSKAGRMKVTGNSIFDKAFLDWKGDMDILAGSESMYSVVDVFSGVYDGFDKDLLTSLVDNYNNPEKYTEIMSALAEAYTDKQYQNLIDSIDTVKPSMEDKQYLYDLLFGTKGSEEKSMLKGEAFDLLNTFGDSLAEASKNKSSVTKFDFLLNIFKNPMAAIKGAGSSLVTTLSGGLTKVISLLATPVGMILGIIAAVVAVISLLYATSKEFRDMFNKVLGGIGNSLKRLFGSIKNAAMKIFEVLKIIWYPIKTVLTAILNVVLPIIGGFIRGMIDRLSIVFDVISAILQPIIDIVTSIAEALGLTDSISSGLEGLASLGRLLGNVLNVCLVVPISIVADLIILIVKAVQSLISLLSFGAVDMPDWSTGWINPLNYWTDQEDKEFATGGVITHPITNATIGEDGAEAIVPLEKNTGWIDRLAEDISTRGGASTNDTYDNSVNVNFEQGSIIVQANNATDAEAERLASIIMEKLIRKIKFNATSSHRQENRKTAKNLSMLMEY